MAASTANAPPSDVATLSKIQKLAVLLILLGPETAALLAKELDEYELEALSAEMSRFRMIRRELQEAVLEEFSAVAVEAGTSIAGGLDYTKGVLEKAVGLVRASDILGRVAPTRTPVAAVSHLGDLAPRQVFNLLRLEQAQTIAMVLSYLPPEKASQVLGLFQDPLRDQIVERLATLSPTPVEVVEKVVEVLHQKSANKQARMLSQSGGVKSTASLLNALDKTLSKSILASIEERNPELVQSIRQKMFTFEDLLALDVSALQKILREVDMRDLAVALKSASAKLKATLLSSISKRAAETVNEEMNFLGTLKLREIEAAQMRIIEVVRKLEAEGEIELGDPKEAKT